MSELLDEHAGSLASALVGRAQELVGRAQELSVLDRFLGRLADGGAALVLLGEPGIGKTVLLDEVVERATALGMRVLRASGAEFEAEVAFATLHQVLLPLRDYFSDHTAGEVLEVALGFATGPAPERLVVANATLDIIRQTGGTRVTLIVVDDLHWLDRASATVLALLGRRLGGSAVGLIGATRRGEDDFFEHAGLPQLVVPALDAVAAGDLLDQRVPTLPERVRQRVLADAEGNPLALLEMPIFSNGAPQAAPPASDATRASSPLRGLFDSRIHSLADSTRQLLLLAALDGSGDLRVLQAAGTTPGGLTDLVAAEKAGLVSVDGNSHRVSFRHPLIRAAVVGTATGEERRGAHRALAMALESDPERRAWHLAEAAVEPDEGVAWLLEDAAHRILRRGDAPGAVTALTRSSELTPDEAVRGRRLAEAAYIGSNVTGSLSDASSLLVEARRAALQGAGSLYASSAAAFILVNGDGDVDTAYRLLIRAIESERDNPDVDTTAMKEALHALEQLCAFGGRKELWEPYREALSFFPAPLPTSLYLTSNVWVNPCHVAPEALECLDQAIAAIDDEGDPIQNLRIATASVFVDRLQNCRHVLWSLVHDGRTGGVLPLAASAMGLLAVDFILTGRWDEADQLSDEGIEICARHGYELLAWNLQQTKSMLASYRGNERTTQEITAEMMRWATPRRVRAVHEFWNLALHSAALGNGDYETAYQCAIAITAPGELPPYVSIAVFTLFGLVEAAVRTGRQVEAEAHVRAMEEANLQAISSRLALVVAGAQGLVASDEDATSLFQKAVNLPGVDQWPFDLARVELAFGEHLRRNRVITQARTHLNAALNIFVALGAKPWSTRAATELRATGVSNRPIDLGRGEALTAQELQVASLAAAGFSNKEIGQKLNMSPRTVGTHLYRTFPKLGITSRAALRDALAALATQVAPPEVVRI